MGIYRKQVYIYSERVNVRREREGDKWRWRFTERKMEMDVYRGIDELNIGKQGMRVSLRQRGYTNKEIVGNREIGERDINEIGVYIYRERE